MSTNFSRRRILQFATAAGALSLSRAQEVTLSGSKRRSTVALVQGNDRRMNIQNALTAIDEQIRPALRRKKYVVIKPNNVSVTNQLASTHADALRGILDYRGGAQELEGGLPKVVAGQVLFQRRLGVLAAAVELGQW